MMCDLLISQAVIYKWANSADITNFIFWQESVNSMASFLKVLFIPHSIFPQSSIQLLERHLRSAFCRGVPVPLSAEMSELLGSYQEPQCLTWVTATISLFPRTLSSNNMQNRTVSLTSSDIKIIRQSKEKGFVYLFGFPIKLSRIYPVKHNTWVVATSFLS